jgi:hypothetical protein
MTDLKNGKEADRVYPKVLSQKLIWRGLCQDRCSLDLPNTKRENKVIHQVLTAASIKVTVLWDIV